MPAANDYWDELCWHLAGRLDGRFSASLAGQPAAWLIEWVVADLTPPHYWKCQLTKITNAGLNCIFLDLVFCCVLLLLLFIYVYDLILFIFFSFVSSFFAGTPHELATEHWQRMIHATKCRKPMPRVIPVSNNTSKRYEPYATILHRCGEDTGCCGSTASVCTVKRQEVVMVYVFVSISIPYLSWLLSKWPVCLSLGRAFINCLTNCLNMKFRRR